MNLETANRLVELRKRRGLSQEELAEALGISRQAISKWERGESGPDVDNAILLGRLYGVSLDELFGVKPEYEEELENELVQDSAQEPMQYSAQVREQELGEGYSRTNAEEEEPAGSTGGMGFGAYEGATTLTINARANVLLRSADIRGVHVELSGPKKETDGCSVVQNGSELLIETEDAKRRIFFGFEGRIKLLIKVTMPRDMKAICASLRGGELRMEGVSSGSIKAKTGGGDISAERCSTKLMELRTGGGEIGIDAISAGRAELHTGGGNIKAQRLEIANDLIAHTGGGDIEIEGSAKSIEAYSGGGDIEIEGSAASAEVKTGGGDVELCLTSCRNVAATTGGGDIEIRLKDCSGAGADLACGGGTAAFISGGTTVARGRRVQAATGDGSAMITARSGGGDISVQI